MAIRPLNSHCKTLGGGGHSILQNKSHVLHGHGWLVGEGSCLVVFTLHNAWQQGITPAECWFALHCRCNANWGAMPSSAAALISRQNNTLKFVGHAWGAHISPSCPTSCLDLLNWRIPPTSYSLGPFSSCDFFFWGSPQYVNSHPIYFTHRFIFYKFL